MNELTPIVVAVAALVSTVYGVLHGNLGALFNLLSPLLTLRGVDFSKLRTDLGALSAQDRATLEAQFDAALSIPDPAALQKFVGAASVLDGAVSLAEGIVTAAFGFYNQGLALWGQAQALLATQPAPVKKPQQARFAALPPWLQNALPGWLPTWLVSAVVGVLVNVALPALAAADPVFAPVIAELIAFLKGGGIGVHMRAALDYAKAQAGATAGSVKRSLEPVPAPEVVPT